MTLIVWPTLTDLQVARAGQAWWHCDAAGCTGEAQVVNGEIPAGWVTTDPEQNPLNGAAQFCPAHTTDS